MVTVLSGWRLGGGGGGEDYQAWVGEMLKRLQHS